MQRRCGQGVVACCCKQPTRRTQSASGKLSQHRSVIKAGPKTGLSGSDPSTAGVYIKRSQIAGHTRRRQTHLAPCYRGSSCGAALRGAAGREGADVGRSTVAWQLRLHSGKSCQRKSAGGFVHGSTRADRAGIEPGTTRAAGPRDKTPTVPEPPKKQKNRVCASLRSRNALVHQAKAGICGKYHAKRSRTEVDTSLCASLRSRNAFQHQAKARICGTYHAKRSRTEVANSLCASLRSRNAFQHQAKARICGTYHAKRSRTEVANSLCASLRSRNALRHQARARICGKYHAKRSRTERAPQSGTKAFSLTVRTP